MPAMLTAEIKQEVRRIIEDQTTGPLNKWKQLESFLFEKKVIYTSRLTSDLMLIHCANRGGSGINIYNMHQKAKNILECGADRSKLNAAVCFEVRPEKKAAQASLTESWHQQYPHYMAGVSGRERYLTVSCSHLSQFCDCS